MNVISLNGDPLVEAAGTPNQTVINALEEALEQARAGKIQGVTMAWLDERAHACWRSFGFVGGFSLVGALEHLKADVMRLNDEAEADG